MCKTEGDLECASISHSKLSVTTCRTPIVDPPCNVGTDSVLKSYRLEYLELVCYHYTLQQRAAAMHKGRRSTCCWISTAEMSACRTDFVTL